MLKLTSVYKHSASYNNRKSNRHAALHHQYYTHPYLTKDIETLEKVQRRATRLMIRNRKIGYQDRLRMLGLTTKSTIERRRLRGPVKYYVSPGIM